MHVITKIKPLSYFANENVMTLQNCIFFVHKLKLLLNTVPVLRYTAILNIFRCIMGTQYGIPLNFPLVLYDANM